MLNSLLALEKEKSGSILSVIKHFNLIKSMKKTLDSRGKPAILSWENAIRRFNNVKKYENITSENIDIAELFLKFGLTQTTFDLASKIRQQANQLKIKNHILSFKLKENSMREQIKNLSSNEMGELVKEIFNKKFTFEFLDKLNPMNFVLGLYADCCATINSNDYGQKITNSVMLSNNTQNIIVKNEDGECVAKATLYVNKKLGYVVINEFDINLKYRENEVITQDNKGGWYSSQKPSEELERQEIFDAFMRGIRSFVEHFNIENVQHIRKVNVGMGNNKLKQQLLSFQKEKQLLQVPDEFGFNDAKYSQYVLFEKTKVNENVLER